MKAKILPKFRRTYNSEDMFWERVKSSIIEGRHGYWFCTSCRKYKRRKHFLHQRGRSRPLDICKKCRGLE